MPNWTRNVLTFSRISDTEFNDILNFIRQENKPLGSFDFNSVVPMPKQLSVTAGSSSDRAIEIYMSMVNPDTEDMDEKKFSHQKFSRVLSKFKKENIFGIGRFNFHMSKAEVDKIREEYLLDHATKREGSVVPTVIEELDIYEYGKILVNNLIQYCHSTWYEWAQDPKNWGTKWNSVRGDADLAAHSISYETAWNAAVNPVVILSKHYPTATIQLQFADEDIGAGCGEMIISNGHIVSQMYPNTDKESIELAAEIWGIDLLDEYYYNPFNETYIYKSGYMRIRTKKTFDKLRKYMPSGFVDRFNSEKISKGFIYTFEQTSPNDMDLYDAFIENAIAAKVNIFDLVEI